MKIKLHIQINNEYRNRYWQGVCKILKVTKERKRKSKITYTGKNTRVKKAFN